LCLLARKRRSHWGNKKKRNRTEDIALIEAIGGNDCKDRCMH
jgi:hypothetical protein